MSTTVVITCDAPYGEGMCAARVHITAREIQQVMNHPDASARDGELDVARHIAASEGWRTHHRWDIGTDSDRCPAHSGVKPRPRKLTP